MGLIESSAEAASENNMRIALERAREASSRERALIRLQEQAGLSDNHNIDLTFAVSSLKFLIFVLYTRIYIYIYKILNSFSNRCCLTWQFNTQTMKCIQRL